MKLEFESLEFSILKLTHYIWCPRAVASKKIEWGRKIFGGPPLASQREGRRPDHRTASRPSIDMGVWGAFWAPAGSGVQGRSPWKLLLFYITVSLDSLKMALKIKKFIPNYMSKFTKNWKKNCRAIYRVFLKSCSLFKSLYKSNFNSCWSKIQQKEL